VSVLRSRAYAAIARCIEGWCRWYTSGLDGAAAQARRDEIASDLHDHGAWAEQSGSRPAVAALSVAGRALRGTAADLSWRRSRIRALPASSRAELGELRLGGSLTALAMAVGSGLVLWGLFVLARTAISVDRGEIEPASQHSALVLALTAIATLGVLLLGRRRTRWVGAVWLLLPALTLVHAGLSALYSTSVTVGTLYFTAPGWSAATHALSLGIAAVFLAVLVWQPAPIGTRPQGVPK
jgi:hypothetical protein